MSRYSQRGHTGHEGSALKNVGLIAGLIGLAWALVAYFVAQGGSALIAPGCVLGTGSLLFMVGSVTTKQ